ncbi:Glutamate 5-kinase [Altererythrobacter insulae]|nr:Glutamate 5-kinase [Altererythrobacter insulae]
MNGRPYDQIMSFAALSDLRSSRRLVVKIGSALLIKDGDPRSAWLESLATDLAELRDHGVEIVIVSSGAIALGAARLNLPEGGRASLSDAQAAASVGQIALAGLWAQSLSEKGFTAAQMLLSLSDLEDRRRYLNAAATVGRLLEAGAVPIINENDSVATEEIRFGDNDRLAARVAQAAGADAVLLLSDVDGLFDRDPKAGNAKLIERVEGVTPEILGMASESSSSGMGSGGMVSKLQAAQIAERAGITLAIIDGTRAAPISQAVSTNRGTVFVPQRTDTARKSWLGGRLTSEGTLTVDAGCANALLKGGASVLAVGVTGVDGAFERGALVEVKGPDGESIAKGLVEYDAVVCRRIAGMREDFQAKILGYAPRAAVVHRDHMVLL